MVAGIHDRSSVNGIQAITRKVMRKAVHKRWAAELRDMIISSGGDPAVAVAVPVATADTRHRQAAAAARVIQSCSQESSRRPSYTVKGRPRDVWGEIRARTEKK